MRFVSAVAFGMGAGVLWALTDPPVYPVWRYAVMQGLVYFFGSSIGWAVRGVVEHDRKGAPDDPT